MHIGSSRDFQNNLSNSHLNHRLAVSPVSVDTDKWNEIALRGDLVSETQQ